MTRTRNTVNYQIDLVIQSRGIIRPNSGSTFSPVTKETERTEGLVNTRACVIHRNLNRIKSKWSLLNAREYLGSPLPEEGDGEGREGLHVGSGGRWRSGK